MKWHAFEVFGIEAEYMVIDKGNFQIRNEVENVLRHFNPHPNPSQADLGKTILSNELVSHVLEIKGKEPEKELKKIERFFHHTLLKVNQLLATKNATLCGTAAHPFMNPEKDSQLWPWGQRDIYQKFNEIFNCKGHGWANLQSVHINLPFKTEEEFARLHAAVRIALPLLPYLSASSPVIERKFNSFPDQRLKFYERNQEKVPLILGDIIPEPIFSYKAYGHLYEKIYAQIAPFDPAGILQHPWLNSRAAIPKFEDGAIEIRIMDIQESPVQDFSIICFITNLIRQIYKEKYLPFPAQKKVSTNLLKVVYSKANTYEKQILPAAYTGLFGVSAGSFDDLLHRLLAHQRSQMPPDYLKGMETILAKGNLAKRMKQEIEKGLALTEILQKLTVCLHQNAAF